MQGDCRGIGDEIVEWLVCFRDDSLSFNRETACFITDNGGILSIVTNDSPVHVEFDFFGIWETLKKASSWPTTACMIHTHPNSLNCMSSVDINMVKGWCIALDVPIVYFIVTENNYAVYVCKWEGGNSISIKDITASYACDGWRGWNYLELIFDVLYGISKSLSVASPQTLNASRDFLNRKKISF